MILSKAKVLSDGQIVRLQFEAGIAAGEAALNRLVDCGEFDYLPAKNAGLVVTANGIAGEVIGIQCEDWDMPLPWTDAPTSGGSISAGSYTFLLAIADNAGHEIYTSPPIWSYSNETGIGIGANNKITFNWRQPVLPGQTLRIYATTTSPNASNMRLAASVPYANLATPTSYTLTSMNASGAAWTPQSVCLTVTLLLASPISAGSAVTISAPAGIVSDGTYSTPAVNSAAVNESVVGSNGFMATSAMSFAQTVYISYSRGNDTTGTGTLSTPYKTMTKASSVISSTQTNVRFCFLRGDTFPFAPWTVAHWGTGLLTPTLYESYWNPAYGTDPGTRPVIMDSPDNNANNILFQQGQSGVAYYGTWPYQYFRGLEIRRDSSLTISGNVCPTNTANDYVIYSDCVFNNICLSGSYGSAQKIAPIGCAFHRCLIAGAAGGSSSNSPHVSGLFIGHCGDWLFSETCFYHNGWRSADGSANDMFNHNVYLSAMCRNVVYHSGWSVDACHSGLQMRGGGVAAYNVFSGNPSNVSSNDGHMFYRNLCLKNNIYNHIASGTNSFGPVAIHDFNLSIGYTGLNETRTVANNYDGAYAFHHNSDGPYVYSSLTVRHETAVDAGGISLGNWQPTRHVKVTHNLIINRADTGKDTYGNGLRSASLVASSSHAYDAGKTTWDLNAYQISTLNSAFSFPDVSTRNFTTWQAAGRDVSGITIATDPAFPTPPSSGYISSAMTALATRNEGEWLPSHSGKNAYNLYAAAYMPAQLTAAADGGFFGATSYLASSGGSGGSGGSSNENSVITVGTGRDDLMIVDDIGARLHATGLFSEIVTGASPAEFEVSADRTSVIWVDRTSWAEQPAAAEYYTERTVQFDVYLSYRHADINICWRYLNQLESVILNTLNRESYAGRTFPSFSYLNRGEDMPAKDGEQVLKLRGMFRYQFVDDRTDHNVTQPTF
ncbi:hypothetical protein UFOVP124_43 [uncultured Caudovirales phage]|uniref:Uncharacterized protein n=1 Tax=uncultured Caudovirales phage TaxID=2100421 RepID=A0A6J5L8B8_9CAUD|nr:hypothetical protein UFOVP124_43 [uncultured Caudovirales phage]